MLGELGGVLLGVAAFSYNSNVLPLQMLRALRKSTSHSLCSFSLVYSTYSNLGRIILTLFFLTINISYNKFRRYNFQNIVVDLSSSSSSSNMYSTSLPTYLERYVW